PRPPPARQDRLLERPHGRLRDSAVRRRHARDRERAGRRRQEGRGHRRRWRRLGGRRRRDGRSAHTRLDRRWRIARVSGGEGIAGRGGFGGRVRPLVFAGNWKMNVGPIEAREYLRAFFAAGEIALERSVWFFPPAVALETVAQGIAGHRNVLAGSQDIYWEPKGAFTGATS